METVTSHVLKIDEKTNCLKIRFDCNRSKKIQKKELVYFLDNGKQANDDIFKTTIEQIYHIVEKTSDLKGRIVSETIFSFNDGCRTYDFTDKNGDNRKTLNNLVVDKDSGNNICSMIQSMITYLKNPMSKNKAFIVILSGCETVNPPKMLFNKLVELHKICKGLAIEIHAIGVGEVHDTYLLEKMVKMSQLRGSYQYVTNSAEMARALDKVYNLVQNFVAIGVVKQKKTVVENDSPPKIVENTFLVQARETSEGVLEGGLYGDIDPAREYHLELYTGRGKLNVQLTPDETEYQEHIALEHKLELIYYRMKALITYMVNTLDNNGMQAMETNISDWENTVQDVITSIKPIEPLKRKPLVEKCLQLRYSINLFKQCIKEVKKRKITIDMFSRLHSCLYEYGNENSDIDSNSIVEEFKKDEAFIKQFAQTFKLSDRLEDTGFPLIKTTYSETPLDYHQLTSFGDCLCMAIELDNDENICNISDEYVSADDFILHSSIGNNEELFSNGNRKFPLPLFTDDNSWEVANLKIKPLLGIAINGNPTRYTDNLIYEIPFRALHYAIVTMFKNPTNETIEHYERILNTLVNIFRNNYEHSDNEDSWTRRLENVYTKYAFPGNTARVDVIDNKLFAAHILIGIKSNCFKKFKSKEDALDFFMIMVEEEMRRNIPVKYRTSNFNEAYRNVKKLLNIDEKYYREHIARFKEYQEGLQELSKKIGESKYAQFAIKKLTTAKINIDDLIDLNEPANDATVDTTVDANDTVCNNDKDTTENIVVDSSVMDNMLKRQVINKLNTNNSITEPTYSDLPDISEDMKEEGVFRILNDNIDCSDLDLFTDQRQNCEFARYYIQMCTGSDILKEPANMVSWVCMILQNVLQSTTNSRKKAIQANGFSPMQKMASHNYITKYMQNNTLYQHIDFTGRGSLNRAVNWLRGIYLEVVETTIKEAQKEIIESMKEDASSIDLMKLFEESDNLLEIVGVLIGSNLGEIMGDLIKRLTEGYHSEKELPRIPLVKEKIELVSTGKFRGFNVFIDADYHYKKTNGRWSPNRKNIYRLWRRNRDSLTKTEWMNLFPNNARAIECRYNNDTYVLDPYMAKQGSDIVIVV